MFQFTALLGARSTSPASQSLLEFDGGVKILIDVGWDDDFDPTQLRELEKQIPSLSIILLTHATQAHLAAFAHCCKHFPLFQQIPIYATAPVISLGRTLIQDIYSSTPLASTCVSESALAEASLSYKSSTSNDNLKILLQPPTNEEIAKYFALIHPLKYSQPHQPLPSPFSPPLNDLTITAYNAGHSLGGTIWHIQHGMESIVYAVDWNQARENVFGSAAWLGSSGAGGAEVIEQLRKPTALVCSARGAEKNTLAGGRKKRDEILIAIIRNAITNNGIVLIPTDSSARVLELAYILDHAWRKETSDTSGSSLRRAKLYLASKTAHNMMRHVRSMLEWMDENVVKEFESEANASNNRPQRRTDSRQIAGPPNTDKNQPFSGSSSNPFDFKFLKIVETQKRISKILAGTGPRVILSSNKSIEWGFSKEVLEEVAKNYANIVVLTDDISIDHDSVSRHQDLSVTLGQWYKEERDGSVGISSEGLEVSLRNTKNRDLQLPHAQRVPLEGKELLVYQQYLATQRQSQEMSQTGGGTTLEASADAVEETSSTSSSSSDESDPGVQGKALNVSAQTARLNKGKLQPDKEHLGVNILLRQPNVYDFDVRGKKGRDQMFPFVNKRRRADDFGELIKPEDYLRAEERDDVDGQDINGTSQDRKGGFGQKRKWQDHPTQDNKHMNGAGPNRRRQFSRRTGPRAGDTSLDDTGPQIQDSSSDESEDEVLDDANVPSRLQLSSESIAVNCKIATIDFAGLHDQRSLTMLIPLIQPKKLVLIGGTNSETTSLADDCRKKLGIDHTDGSEKDYTFVYTPNVGQMVDASVDTNAWNVKLTEALVKRFQWQKVRNLSIVTLMGQLAAGRPSEALEESESRKKMKLMTEDDKTQATKADVNTGLEMSVIPTLDVLPASLAAASRSAAQPLHVGDLRLADLRKVLLSNGHTADFRGEGTLLVDNLVAVRKSKNGMIEVESGGNDPADLRIQQLEGAFYAVKRKIYECLAVIAGG